MYSSAEAAYQFIKNKIESLKFYQTIMIILLGVILSLIGLIVSLLLAISLDWLLTLSYKIRLIIVILSAILLLSIIVKSILIPLLKKRTIYSLSKLVEKHFPQIKGSLLSSIELWNIKEQNKEKYSEALIDVFIQQTAKKSEELNFRDVISLKPIFFWGKVLSITVVAMILYLLIAPQPFVSSVKRFINPSVDADTPIQWTINVSPGNASVLRGESLKIDIKISPKINDESYIPPFVSIPNVYLMHKNYGRRWKMETCVAEQNSELKIKNSEKIKDTTVSNIQSSIFTYTLNNLEKKTEYYIKVGNNQSDTYTINVSELPIITRIKLKYIYPAYTKFPSREVDENTGDIIAIKGTKVNIMITSNNELVQSSLVFSDSRIVQMSKYQKDNRSLETTITVTKDESYKIKLVDIYGKENPNPVDYTIKSLNDEYPIVRIVEPAKDVDMNESMRVPLVISATDDYGLTSMRLVYKKGTIDSNTKESSIEITNFGGAKNDIKFDYEWDLAPLDMMPEDIITYHIEIYDNDTVSGPKKSKSESFTVRFPSIAEIFDEVNKKQEEQISELEDMIPEAKGLKEKIEQMRREMLKNPNMDWEKKKEVESTLKKQEEIVNQIEQMAEKMNEIMDKLEQNADVNQEILEKMKEVQKLMKEISTPEMQKALQKLQEAMQRLDPQEIQKAMQNMTLSQEDFLKRLERTAEMLKQIQQEMKMESLVKKSEELLQRQDELAKATENAKSPEELKALSEKQAKLKEDLDQLKKDIQELSEMMKENDPDVSKKLDDISKSMDAKQMSQKMFSISESMKQGNKSQSQAGQQDILPQLAELSQDLQNAQGMMKQNIQKEVMQALRKAIHDLIFVSKEQEKLIDNSKSIPLQDEDKYSTLAEEQLSLFNSTTRIADDIYKISQKTFVITPQIGQKLGQALSKMKDATTSLEQRNRGMAEIYGNEAIASVNQAVIELMKSQQSCASGSGGMSMQQLMQQLEQMAGTQGELNEETRQLYEQMLKDQLSSMAAREGMARLSQQQEALRKTLEEMRREMEEGGGEEGKEGRLGKQLDELAKEMEKVVKDLQNQNVDRETIERQQKILTRLLDAQRSIRERDYSRKRKAETGKDYAKKDPGPLPDDLGNKKNRYKEDLLKALQEGYPPEYEELIKAYFKALSER